MSGHARFCPPSIAAVLPGCLGGPRGTVGLGFPRWLRCSRAFAEVGPDREVWEYAALVTSLNQEILTLGQLYRGRGDCENAFDELKNQWGWGGVTTHDLKRCRLLAGSVALIFNWWSLFVRLADPDHRSEAITSRPLLMQAIARHTQHAGQVTLTISSTHGEQHKARQAYQRIAGFLAWLRKLRSSWTQRNDGIAS